MNAVELQKLARRYVRPALKVLADIAENGENEKVRREAAKELRVRLRQIQSHSQREFLK